MMFLGLFGLDIDINLVIPAILRLIGAGVCNLIYWLISKFFQLFMIVSQLNILSSTDIEPIYQRVTLILTIVMTFYITLEFIKYVVQPDAMTDKEKGVGNIITRIIIAIVLIAFVPKIFTIAYDVQNKLISNQVFSKVFLGETNTNFETFGSDFSANMLGVFYAVDEDVCGGSNDSECAEAEDIVESNLFQLREGGEVTLLPGINSTKEITVNGETQEVFLIRFDGLMAILIGGIILFIVVLYTIDVGVRFAQLLFLQVIAPIAIIGYISPKKDGMFQKWLKQCTTTYLDLFIRLAIIYFVLLIVNILTEAFKNENLFEGMSGVGVGYETLTYLVLVIGLLVFAKKAPKMLGEILPGGGGSASIGFGAAPGERWGSAKKLFNAGRRSVGGAAGGLYGLSKSIQNNKGKDMKGRDKAWSAMKAGYQGLKAGAGKGGNFKKAQQAAQKSIQGDESIIDDGGSITSHDFRGVHYQELSTKRQKEIKDYEGATKAKDTVSSQTKEMKVMKTAMAYKEEWKQQGIGDASQREAAVKDIEKASRIYAVSSKDVTAQATLKTSVTAAVDKVYGTETELTTKVNKLTSDANRINNELANLSTTSQEYKQKLEQRDAIVQQRDAVKKTIEQRTTTIKNLEANMEIGSVNWNKLHSEIKEAQRVTKDLSEIIIEVEEKVTDPVTGQIKVVKKEKTVSQLTEEQFAKYIGDIADKASEIATERKYSKETRQYKANADESKK